MDRQWKQGIAKEENGDSSTQQPAERRVMHESDRWHLFPFDCHDHHTWKLLESQTNDMVDRLLYSCDEPPCDEPRQLARVRRGYAVLA